MDTQGNMKKVPIFFYYMSVETERSSTPYDATNTANLLCAIFSYLNENTLVNRRFELTGKKKVMWLHEHLRRDKGKNLCIDVVFKSAKYDQSRNVIDTVSMEQKGRIKKENDGDEEKTHLSLRLGEGQQLYVAVFESNYYGVGIKNVESYINEFAEKYYIDNEKDGTFRIHFEPYLSTDFLDELKKMKRKNVLSITVDKDILSSDFMFLAGRNDIKDTITITIGKKGRGKNIPEDLIKSMYGEVGKDKIKRIRVEGSNQGGSLKIDTESLQLKHSLVVETTNDTHEVSTFDIFKKIQEYIEAIGV